MKKIYSILLALLVFSLYANAQSQLGEIRGKVIDAKTKKPMDFVSVSIYLNGVLKASTLTDDEGGYVVKTLQPGEYEVKVTYLNYRNSVVTGVDVSSDNITFQNINMESNEGGQVLKDFVVERKKPLVDPEGKGGGTVTAKEVMRLPTRSVNMVANTIAGVDARAGNTPNFRGARADGTAYYIDGIRVNGGGGSVPTGAVDQIQVITGGTPALYGDFIGGAISISTKSPSRNYQKSIEYRTSSPFNGYLDNSNYNYMQTYVSGPIKIINKDKGDKERVLIGFAVAADGIFSNGGITPIDMYKVKDDVLRQIQAKPLTKNPTGGFINSAEFLTKNDLEKVYVRQNSNSQAFNLQGNFTYQPAKDMNLKFGYRAQYNRGIGGSFASSLMNYDNNRLSTYYFINPYIQFTQSFNKKTAEETKKSLVSNAFYTIRFSYERIYSQSENPEFGQDFFKYGYLGKFKTYSMPFYTQVRKNFGDSADVFTYTDNNGVTKKLYLTQYYKQASQKFDTLVTFEQTSYNTVKGNYTKAVLDYYDQSNIRLSNSTQISQSGGLLNGYDPTSVYSMWTNVGASQGGFSKSQFENYSVFLMSEASVGTNAKAKHDLQFGFSYEQQIQRGYGLGASGLWQLMPVYVNGQFTDSLSPSNAILKFNSNGVFMDTVRYSPYIKAENQSNFDKNLRAQLIASHATDVYGNPITATSKIDVNNYDPSMFKLSMFNASELLNNGNSFVNYYGYDYLGNPISGKQSIDKFINDPTNRSVGAFMPIYMAAWVQDKFVFKDLIVRLGVRMDRYDANQLELKDPYSLYPVYTVGDVKRNTTELMNRISPAIPGTMGDNYVVYIDDENQSVTGTKISGYRNGNDWFDAAGNPVTDPSTLYKTSLANNASGSLHRNTPFLVNQGQTKISSASFTDYVPDIKISPRVWFSFPISTTAQFFGTYDVLAQRPNQGYNQAQIDDYYYIFNRIGAIIPNPDLKMTQVTDYEIGFRQQIGDNSSLGIIASYREFRNLLQQYKYVQAWPIDYTTYGNLDFSTTKSIRLEYELRDIGNINLSANYMLSFSDGTGSNANTSGTLIQSGLAQQRNVFPLDYDTRHTLKGVFDYHYKEGKNYNGPIVSGKKIFENAGFNVIFNATSGRPYTQVINPMNSAQDGIVQRSQVKGTINSSNLPSQFFTDINIDKYFMMKSQSIEGKTSMYSLRIYFEIQNIFNAANVLGVYQYTGSAYDDGYIMSPNAASSIRNATNAQSFIDLYNIKILNPGNFALPRLTRLGISLSF